MKKITIFVVKLLVVATMSLIGTIFVLALLIGWAEGDLSHGIFYYL